MAIEKNTYGMPDPTLQLIARSQQQNSLMPQQNSPAQFATPDVRSSNLISALRGIPGASNSGFTRYANAANGAALSPTMRTAAGANSPAQLTMPTYVAPPLPVSGGGDTASPTPINSPISFVPRVIPEPVFEPVLEPELPSPDEDFPPTYIEPVLPSPDEDFPPTYIEPALPSPDEDFPSTYIEPEPVDKSYWDDEVREEVGPSRGLIKNQEELPEEFDQYLQPLPSPDADFPSTYPEPEPYVPEPAPYVPELEPYVSEFDPFFPEPEPEPIADDEAAFIDTWLADQFGGGSGFDSVADDFGKYGLGVSHFGGSGGKGMFDDFLDNDFSMYATYY